MKTLLLIISLLTSVCQAATDTPFTIRDVPWGATKKQVIHSEIGRPDYQVDGNIAFESRLADRSVTVLFEFLDDSLHRVTYQFEAVYFYGQPYIDDFQAIEDLIRKKYGKPTKAELVWHSDIYDKSELADAVQAGAVSLFSGWKRPNVLIVHELATRDAFSREHTVSYEDPAQEKRAKDKEIETALDDL